MSFLDRIIAAVTPPESDETRMEARARARVGAVKGGWLQAVIDQHDEIETAFAEVARAPDATAQRRAEDRLVSLLNAHSAAEESVLYPEMADSGHKTHASMAYEEQAMTKVQLALLQKLEPLTKDYLDKLEHIRGAVTHHMYQEESSWLLDLQQEVPEARQEVLAMKFRNEVGRYLGEPVAA